MRVRGISLGRLGVACAKGCCLLSRTSPESPEADAGIFGNWPTDLCDRGVCGTVTFAIGDSMAAAALSARAVGTAGNTAPLFCSSGLEEEVDERAPIDRKLVALDPGAASTLTEPATFWPWQKSADCWACCCSRLKSTGGGAGRPGRCLAERLRAVLLPKVGSEGGAGGRRAESISLAGGGARGEGRRADALRPACRWPLRGRTDWVYMDWTLWVDACLTNGGDSPMVE